MKSTHLRLKLAPKLDILKNFSLLTLMVLALFAYSCSDDDDDDDDVEDPGDKELVLEEIAMGARLHGTNGINFGPDGDLYIASFIGQEVVSMNKQTGEIINTYGVDKNVLGPDDLIFHPDGESFYYTDIVTGFVGRMTPDGTLLGYQEVAPGVNPITFSDDGRLFVGLDFEGDGLYELDPNLVEPPRAIVPYVPDTFPLGFLNAFDFGPDGRLYGPSFLFGLVISVDVGEPGDPPTSDPYGDGTAQVVADGLPIRLPPSSALTDCSTCWIKPAKYSRLTLRVGKRPYLQRFNPDSTTSPLTLTAISMSLMPILAGSLNCCPVVTLERFETEALSALRVSLF
jgi:hypothetical protein